MREINFRALWTDGYCEPKWVYGYLTERDGNILIDPGGEEDAFIIITKHENSVGQYTGLKDKNGKEIFEGDIVAFEDSDGGYEYPDAVVNTGIVEYGELRFYFTNRIAAEMDDFYIKDGRCDDVEVIGNIHENPELLGVQE